MPVGAIAPLLEIYSATLRLGGEGHRAILQQCDRSEQWRKLQDLSEENFDKRAIVSSLVTPGLLNVNTTRESIGSGLGMEVSTHRQCQLNTRTFSKCSNG